MVATITVDFLPTISLIGHSNADGWGKSDKLLAQHTYFIPMQPLSATADVIERCYWKNIFVASSPQPMPGSGHTPSVANVGDVAWLELTIANIKQTGDAHPHSPPHNYPNNRGSCYPRYYYNAWVVTTFDGFHYDYSTGYAAKFEGTLVGIEIPLMVYWRDDWGSEVGLVKMAFSSSLFLPQEDGPPADAWLDIDVTPPFANTPASAQVGPLAVPSAVDTSIGGFNAWWTPEDQFDWSPGTDRLFGLWLDKMQGAADAMPAGKKMDVQLLVVWVGDNDSLSRSRATLESSFKAAYARLIYRMRRECVDNEWTTLPLDQIAVVAMGVHGAYLGPETGTGFDSVAFCNEQITAIATDDPFMRVVPTTGFTVLSQEADTPPLGMGTGTSHLSHNGYVQAAKAVMEAWRDIRQSTFDAIPLKDRVTLATALTELGIHYDRGGIISDANRATNVAAINNAIRDVVNMAGDSCWWLNRTIDMVLTSNSQGVIDLPLHVARALEIRNPNQADRNIQFQQLGFGNGGRCQIIFVNEDQRCGVGTGTYKVKHIGWPIDVTEDRQHLPIPRQLLEWVILEACKRLASGSSDVGKYALLGGESREVAAKAMRQIARQHQAQRDAIANERPRFRIPR